MPGSQLVIEIVAGVIAVRGIHNCESSPEHGFFPDHMEDPKLLWADTYLQ